MSQGTSRSPATASTRGAPSVRTGSGVRGRRFDDEESRGGSELRGVGGPGDAGGGSPLHAAAASASAAAARVDRGPFMRRCTADPP